MNCQNIADLIDERDIGKLTASEREDVAAHLATCSACAGDWQAFERVLARRRPDMPADFPARLWRSLAPAIRGSAARGRGARPYLLGGLLLVGAAAALVGWQSRREPESAPIASVPGSLEEDSENSQSPPPAATGREAAPAEPTAPDAIPASSRSRIVVLPTAYENPGHVAIDAVDAIRPATLQVLRALPNVEVVEIIQAQIDTADIDYSGIRSPLPRDRAYAIATYFGGDFSLQFANDTVMGRLLGDTWTIEAAWRGANGGNASMVSASRVGPQASAESQGDSLARDLYGQMFPAAARAVWEMIVADVAQPESRRLDALSRAQEKSGDEIPSGLADATVASAIDLARTSADPATRYRIWQILGNYVYPAAREPIIDALRYDPDAWVRTIAARVLYAYLPDPAVSAALSGASADDASDAVRLRARWSLMSGRERDAFVAANLRDPGRSDEQKVAPLRFLSRDYDDPLDPALLRILDEIALRSPDPAARAVALAELGRSADPEHLDAPIEALRNDADVVVRRTAVSAMSAIRRQLDGSETDESEAYIDPLIVVLTRDPDPEVRRSAAYLLREYATPAVIAALENALERESDPDVRRAIEQSLPGLD